MHDALPRGLISRTNLPLIRLRPPSVFLLLSSLSSFSFHLCLPPHPLFLFLLLHAQHFVILKRIKVLFTMDGLLTRLSEPQALFSLPPHQNR